MLEQRRGSNKKTMKHESNVRKHRSRGSGGGSRRNGGGSRQKFADGNGQKVKVRGNASQILEKYLSLARDATAASDRVAAENYYQHAEHYYRSMHSSDEHQETPKPVNSDKQTVTKPTVAEMAAVETAISETEAAKPAAAKTRGAKSAATKAKSATKADPAPASEASPAVSEA